MTNQTAVRVGQYLHFSNDLKEDLKNAKETGFSFIVTPLSHPASKEFVPYCDLFLLNADWAMVVGEICTRTFQSFAGMGDPSASCCVYKGVDAQINYAVHLGISAVYMALPATYEAIHMFSRLINSRFVSTNLSVNSPHFWIGVQICSDEQQSCQWMGEKSVEDEETDETRSCSSWAKWNAFRLSLSPDKRIGIALEVSGDLPDADAIDRWAGEPVKALIVPTSLFLTNNKGYPVLSKSMQSLLRILIEKMARDIQLIVKGNCHHGNYQTYIQYMEHLKKKMPVDASSNFAQGYEDYLQIPLQPLMDNLESCTYEIFEKDPVKYSEYEKAITGALSAIEPTDNGLNIIVMVVGAGRGPLVQATLRAAKQVAKYVIIYAVEKNENAIVTLETLQQEKWGGHEGTASGRVHVVRSDVRDWVAPQKADLVVSELLGSFGDNELSPECLDGVYRSVKDTAISVPASYTSYLVPIQSQKLYTETALLREKDKHPFHSFESSYVVHIRNCYLIGDVQPLFQFQHTHDLHLHPSQRDNNRYRILSFSPALDVVCHGFAGYFETTLFGDIKLSTKPKEQTDGMFSWFPIYFPIRDPIAAKKSQSIDVHFWRIVGKKSVWYEWRLSSPTSTLIHNPNGRSHAIGL